VFGRFTFRSTERSDVVSKRWEAGHITILREALGLSKSAFARRLGVGRISVIRWEQGRQIPRGLSVRALDALEQEAIHGSDQEQEAEGGKR